MEDLLVRNMSANAAVNILRAGGQPGSACGGLGVAQPVKREPLPAING